MGKIRAYHGSSVAASAVENGQGDPRVALSSKSGRRPGPLRHAARRVVAAGEGRLLDGWADEIALGVPFHQKKRRAHDACKIKSADAALSPARSSDQSWANTPIYRRHFHTFHLRPK